MTSARPNARPAARLYTWSFPGCPVRVRIALDLVERMQESLAKSPGQGLLMGAESTPGITEVTGFYPLSQTGVQVSDMTAARAETPTLSVVGYYRNQLEPELRLNENDLVLARTWFQKPHCVLLLIGPAGSEPAGASFFFWDKGTMNGDFAYLEFPFDAIQLGALERRNIAEQNEERHSAQLGRTVVSARKKAMLVSAATLGLAVGGFGIQRFVAKGTAIPAVNPGGELFRGATFSLQAERQGSDLVISWDRNSEIIVNAKGGELSVREGDLKAQIALDAHQLHSGSVVYSPFGDQVGIELSVLTSGGTARRESVLFFLPRHGALRPAPAAIPISRFKIIVLK